MTGFETAVAAYIAEHGEINADAYNSLAELYKVEGVADLKAAIKLKMGGAGNDKLDRTLAKMTVTASDPAVKQLASRCDTFFDERIKDVQNQCQAKGLGKDSDIAKEYEKSASKAKTEISSAIKSIADEFSKLNPTDAKVFHKFITGSSAINEGDIIRIREIAGTLNIQLAATKAYQEANKKVKAMITVAADAAKKAGQTVAKAGQTVADTAKKGYDAAKAGVKKGVNATRTAAGKALEELALKMADRADKIKNIKESTFNEIVADYVAENGSIDDEIYNAIRDLCDSL